MAPSYPRLSRASSSHAEGPCWGLHPLVEGSSLAPWVCGGRGNSMITFGFILPFSWKINKLAAFLQSFPLFSFLLSQLVVSAGKASSLFLASAEMGDEIMVHSHGNFIKRLFSHTLSILFKNELSHSLPCGHTENFLSLNSGSFLLNNSVVQSLNYSIILPTQHPFCVAWRGLVLIVAPP